MSSSMMLQNSLIPKKKKMRRNLSFLHHHSSGLSKGYLDKKTMKRSYSGMFETSKYLSPEKTIRAKHKNRKKKGSSGQINYLGKKERTSSTHQFETAATSDQKSKAFLSNLACYIRKNSQPKFKHLESGRPLKRSYSRTSNNPHKFGLIN